MSDQLLSKPKLPPGHLDCAVGEAYIVKDALVKQFDLSSYTTSYSNSLYEYPFSSGHPELVRLLEEKHQAPVIITNGATQALGASFEILRQNGQIHLGMRTPYWARIPGLARMHGLNPLTSYENSTANLLLLPNNPDGYAPASSEIALFEAKCKDEGKTLIHDGAYWTGAYMPANSILKPIGDLQIHSISKSFGLSGLRLGYIVCHNTEFYKPLQDYIESSTVGVSNLSQIFLADLLSRMKSYPTLTGRFENEANANIRKAKNILKQIDPELIEIPNNIEDTIGIFGWFKVLRTDIFDKAKINVAWGEHFGGEKDFVRMNLAFSEDKMTEIVNRINGAKNL